ncbi:hypothetical protein E3P78_00697 [Wallemia ichthyophaga]|nr:hypothetical protein E3P78_00697 [Wallemia ichthyophaga]
MTLSNLFKRSKLCGLVGVDDLNSTVNLAGHLISIRRLNKAKSFIDLRDHSGVIQLITPNTLIPPNTTTNSVIQVSGQVKLRDSSNSNLRTGSIELDVHRLDMLNAARSLPFNPLSPTCSSDVDLKLKHRYLDLRSTRLTQTLQRRSQITHSIRTHLHSLSFTEIETPILLNSSSEGAREFLVPTRSSDTPSFYALSQSPQQPKQLLIASGCTDAYFQIARCFRDEDGRKDRQPEFTQLDVEMAYVNGAASPDSCARGWNIGGEQIRQLIQGLVGELWARYMHTHIPSIPVMSYTHAMNTYGSDKPDLRFDLAIRGVAEGGGECVGSGGVKQTQIQTRALTLDKATASRVSAEFYAAHPPTPPTPQMVASLGLQEGDVVWCEDTPVYPDGGGTALGALRLALADHLALPHTTPYAFTWITEFPLFTRADEDKAHLSRGRYASTHHPFTAPHADDVHLLHTNPERVRGQHYDLVLNGCEIGGGSVRIHEADLQESVFRDVLRLSEKEVGRFSHLLQALASGAPPHAGIALGLDRLIALMCDTTSIRDTIAFPKSLNGRDRLFGSPSPSQHHNLADYRLAAMDVDLVDGLLVDGIYYPTIPSTPLHSHSCSRSFSPSLALLRMSSKAATTAVYATTASPPSTTATATCAFDGDGRHSNLSVERG